VASSPWARSQGKSRGWPSTGSSPSWRSFRSIWRFLNLLPIPILDAGSSCFSSPRRCGEKPLSRELRTRLSNVGFFLLVVLMILALTNDALRILPVRDALESYLAGRVKAERLVIAVSAEYYQEARDGRREALQPLIDRDRSRVAGDRSSWDRAGRFGIRDQSRRATVPEAIRSGAAAASGGGASGSGKQEAGNVRPPKATGLWGWIRSLFAPRQPDHHSRQRPSHPVGACVPPSPDRRAAASRRGSGRPGASRDIS